MCDPFTVTAALSVGGSVFGFAEAEQQAKSQAKFAEKRAIETGRAITADAVQQFSQIGVRREQEADAARLSSRSHGTPWKPRALDKHRPELAGSRAGLSSHCCKTSAGSS